MKRLLTFCFMLMAIVPSMHHLYAWGQKGHRIVAQVAYDNLTNKARKQVDAVLGKQGMIYLSTWPDEIKSDTIYPTSFTCHYQDLDGGCQKHCSTRFPKCQGQQQQNSPRPPQQNRLNR